MRILLDENLNWRLERHLPGHDCWSVPRIGWAGMTNGQLLAAADRLGFDVFLTMDKALAIQQNLAHVRLAVVVLRAPSNRLDDTSPLMPQVLALLSTLTAGKVIVVGP